MKTKTKRIYLLLIALVAMVTVTNAEPNAYAVYRGGTLTFKFVERPTNETYCFNAWNTGTSPEWKNSLQLSLIENVVFDSSFKNARPKSCANWFNGMENLKTVTNLEYLNTSEVSSMAGMFANCPSLTSLDVSGFNTSNVTTMYIMFKGCEKLTSLNVSRFNTSNVTNMEKMFMGCKSLKNLDVSGFNTSNVKDMSFMFYECHQLTSLDVTGFNTSNVTDMSRMFESCERLTSLDVRSFNTSKVTNMFSMFYWCKYLTSLDVRNFDTSNVTDMRLMFSDCQSLTTIYCNDSWNSSCSSDNMFSYCTNLKGAISYNKSKVTAAYANHTTGYFTYKLNSYSLMINGTQVTDLNAPNLASIDGVQGSVKFDDAAKTLTLTNAAIYTTANETSAIQSNLDSLYIVVNGECAVGSTKLAGIAGSSHIVIKGDGKLTVIGISGISQYLNSNSLTVTDGVQLDIQGFMQYGINGCKALKVNGKDTKLRLSGTMGCCTNVEALTLTDDLAITDPSGAKYSGNTIVDKDGNVIKNNWVTIEYAEPYGLTINGTQVTSANHSDLTVISGVTGTATYDDETKTLTLTDCVISMDVAPGSAGIKSNMDSLAIHLVGNNSIGMVDTGIECSRNLTIAGPGKLDMMLCGTGIAMTDNIYEAELAICDDAKLSMVFVGTGIVGTYVNKPGHVFFQKDLRISGGNSDVDIIASQSAVSDMNVLTLNDGIALSAPVGAKYSGGDVLDKDGNLVQNKKVRFSHLGDVNNDGAVTMADANAVVNYFLATDKPYSFDVDNANVNGDGDDDGKPSITMADANAIVNMFLGGQ